MAGSDDLLTPEEIEALMAAARGNSAYGDTAAEPRKPAGEAERSQPRSPAPPRVSGPNPDELLQEAERNLAAAMSSGRTSSSRRMPPDLGSASPFQFESFERPSSRNSGSEFPIAALQDVELDLRIELGRTELLIEEVLQLREGAVVPLDKLAGDPVDILVNGRLIARGEVLVLNDNFCVRVAEILAPAD